MANAQFIIILVYYSMPLSLAQMGFGGGGYCAKCAMANSGMNSHSFGFGGMSSNPNFGSSLSTNQVGENNFAKATFTSLSTENTGVNSGSAYGVYPVVNTPSTTPSTHNRDTYRIVTTNPCMNGAGGCIILSPSISSPCCNSGGCCGNFNSNFGDSAFLISPNALSSTTGTDASNVNAIQLGSNANTIQLSSFRSSNPFETGTFSSLGNTGNLFTSSFGSYPFGTTLSSFVPLTSTNNFGSYVFTGRRRRRHSSS